VDAYIEAVNEALTRSLTWQTTQRQEAEPPAAAIVRCVGLTSGRPETYQWIYTHLQTLNRPATTSINYHRWITTR
jgi:hypothetical protein